MIATETIEAIRAFNRFYTNRLGLLAKGYLATPYTLTEGRILYELGSRRSISSTQLNRDLGLDPAYLSRILKKFREAGSLRPNPIPSTGVAASSPSPLRERRSIRPWATGRAGRSPAIYRTSIRRTRPGWSMPCGPSTQSSPHPPLAKQNLSSCARTGSATWAGLWRHRRRPMLGNTV
nr:MarR family transcriptional regulator [Rhizobium sp. Q54]